MRPRHASLSFLLFAVGFGALALLHDAATRPGTEDRSARAETLEAGDLRAEAPVPAPQRVVVVNAGTGRQATRTATYALTWQRETRVQALSNASDLLPQARTDTLAGTVRLCLHDRRDDELLWTAALAASDGQPRSSPIRIRTHSDGTWLGIVAEDSDIAADDLAILRCLPLVVPCDRLWQTDLATPLGTARCQWTAVRDPGRGFVVVRRADSWRPATLKTIQIRGSGATRATWRAGATDRPDAPPPVFFTDVTVDESQHVEHPHLGIAIDHRVVAHLERASDGPDEPLAAATWEDQWQQLLPGEIRRPWRAELRPIALASVLDAVACAQRRDDPLDPRLGQTARLLPELFWHVPERIEDATRHLLREPVDLTAADLLVRALARVGDERCERALLAVLERGAAAVRHAVVTCTDELATPSAAWISRLQALANAQDADALSAAAWLALARVARRIAPDQAVAARAARQALGPSAPVTTPHVAPWLQALAATELPDVAKLAAPHARSPLASIRAAAAAALGACDGEHYASLLRDLAARDPAADVRRQAANSLAWLEQRGVNVPSGAGAEVGR